MDKNRRHPPPASPDDRLRRMAMLGELLAEATHEINNMMMGVMGYAEVELASVSEPKSLHNVGQIVECAQSVQNLTRNLTKLAHPGSVGKAGNVNHAVESIAEIFHRLMTAKSICFGQEMVAELPTVTLCTGDLRLVLANLVKNAIDALEISQNKLLRITAEESADAVSIGIWNSGPPIPDPVLDRLFTPFYSTKDESQGTGLGLVIARRMVMQVGGVLEAENVDDGVLFRVILPKAKRQEDIAPKDTNLNSSLLTGQRVLVVDDENTAREVLELMVTRMGGAMVETCDSGEEALKLLFMKDFDAVLLDLRMGNVSGQDVYRSLPEQTRRRVVFVTGDTVGTTTLNFLRETHQPAVFKPVDWKELLLAVRQVTAV